MNKKLYVGNLSHQTTVKTLLELFGAIGKVTSVNLVTDPTTGRSKGFAVIKMAKKSAARKAIDQLNGRRVDGRNIRVATERPQRIPEPNLPWGMRGHKPSPWHR
jgi:RNA recognition motif-containing protein